VKRGAIMAEIENTGVIAVIRAESPDDVIDIVRALADGGVTACELTMTIPGALDAIAVAARELGGRALIGAGTVLDAQTARAAILAGAQFLVAPVLDRGTIEMAHRYDRAVIPGAMTPTEILAAWSAGADAVKVFPATALGPQYFRDIAGPLPQVRLTPTGGVDLDSAGAWIRAGAVAIGVGGALVRKDLVASRSWEAISELAARYIEAVRAARAAA
jgi:2-dehydro-3-deoxyphosphogluconate aldolase/(4S)-4-hydroxy-2-oxoglutarate aldolase